MVLRAGYFLESYGETFRKYQYPDLLPRNSDSVGVRWIQALVVFKICPGDFNIRPSLRTTALKDVTGRSDGTYHVQLQRTEYM